jgi:predicted O-methyltransferase YrrM
VYSSFQLAVKYLRYYFTALNGKGHGMHSPFIFQFILNVLNNKSNFIPPPEVETMRQQLLRDSRQLQIEDLGAGSRVNANKTRTVRQLARTAVKSFEYSQLLYRLVSYYQPKNIVELGTSLGITTAYMARANPASKITTIEGSLEVAAVANETLAQLGVNNVEQLIGNFDDELPVLLEALPYIDMAYIDGNHRYEPTLRYFYQFLEKHHNDTIMIFDDIHWSTEMEKAWEEIKQHEAVHCTVDIFFLGFVFFRSEFKEKQHFTVKF